MSDAETSLSIAFPHRFVQWPGLALDRLTHLPLRGQRRHCNCLRTVFPLKFRCETPEIHLSKSWTTILQRLLVCNMSATPRSGPIRPQTSWIPGGWCGLITTIPGRDFRYAKAPMASKFAPGEFVIFSVVLVFFRCFTKDCRNSPVIRLARILP